MKKVCMLVAAALLLSSAAALADEVTLTSITTASFINAKTNKTVVPKGLSFTGTTTTVTTGGAPVCQGTICGGSASVNMGTLMLSSSNLSVFTGLNFNLAVTFAAPTGIAGGQNTSYSAQLYGQVTPLSNKGGVSVCFSPSLIIVDCSKSTANGWSQSFTFNSATAKGWFVLSQQDIRVASPGIGGGTIAVPLVASLTGGQTPVAPEPSSLLLFGTGLAGVSSALRRRRKS